MLGEPLEALWGTLGSHWSFFALLWGGLVALGEPWGATWVSKVVKTPLRHQKIPQGPSRERRNLKKQIETRSKNKGSRIFLKTRPGQAQDLLGKPLGSLGGPLGNPRDLLGDTLEGLGGTLEGLGDTLGGLGGTFGRALGCNLGQRSGKDISETPKDTPRALQRKTKPSKNH
jgi:hypothetical protein